MQRGSPRVSLVQAVMQAKNMFERVVEKPWCVTPAVLILFFGDLDAYCASPLCVLTVGLNPSLREFPADKPFRRFPLAEDSLYQEPDCYFDYFDAMSAYFRTDPYCGWFSAFEHLLNGMEASYYDDGDKSRALHTDICSPIATNPTWSRLKKTNPEALKVLEACGIPLWHMLLRELRPQIVVLSVAKEYLGRIEFKPVTEWVVIRTFTKTRSGDLRSQPYEVEACWYEIGDERSLFVFGRAAQKPFGLLSDEQKQDAGSIIVEEYNNGG